MALAETIEYDKIEVVGQYKHVQVRKATVVKSICTAAWTTAVKDAWKAKLIADKSSGPA